MDEIKVRVATPDDEDAIMEACNMIHAENAIFTMDEPKVREMIRYGLRKQGGIIGVIGKNPLEGVICLRIGQYWYSSDPTLDEMFTFVHPDFRNAPGGRASKLVDFAKSVSNRLKFPLIIGVLSNHKTEAKVRLYERRLGKPAGAFFLYGATTGQVEAPVS